MTGSKFSSGTVLLVLLIPRWQICRGGRSGNKFRKLVPNIANIQICGLTKFVTFADPPHVCQLDLQFADPIFLAICGYAICWPKLFCVAICGLAHLQNLWIFNLQINQKKFFGFEICELTFLRNLRICDCRLGPRICGFKSICATTFANLPPVSTKPSAKLPSVSTTPMANCHWYQRHQQ